MAKNQHVVPHQKGWAVKGDGNQRATKVARTQQQALTVARRIARNQGADVVIHGRDGKIWDSYGRDLTPPPDLKH